MNGYEKRRERKREQAAAYRAARREGRLQHACNIMARYEDAYKERHGRDCPQGLIEYSPYTGYYRVGHKAMREAGVVEATTLLYAIAHAAQLGGDDD